MFKNSHLLDSSLLYLISLQTKPTIGQENKKFKKGTKTGQYPIKNNFVKTQTSGDWTVTH